MDNHETVTRPHTIGASYNYCSHIVSGEGFLPFLYPTSYRVLTDTSWGSALVALPTPLHSRGFEYDTAYVSKWSSLYEYNSHRNRSALGVQSVLGAIVIIIVIIIIIIIAVFIIIMIVIIIIVTVSTSQLLLLTGNIITLYLDQDNYVIKWFLDPLLSSLKLIDSYPIILTFHLKLTGYCGLTGMMCVLTMIVTAPIMR